MTTPTYYIETSIGRIEFKSSLEPLETMDKCFINHSETHGIIPQDLTLFKKFLTDLYNWHYISISWTLNGYFMNIHLSDDYYGSPEYKVFTRLP